MHSQPLRTLTLVALLLVGGSADVPATQFTPFEAAIAAFDAEVAAAVAEDAGGAVSVAVFIGNDVVWAKGYGWADIEGRVAATAETIGRTGSISKSFTAVLMMQLAERGVLDIDDPVADYFPEIAGLADAPQGAAPVTFRMLASHTAGLIREPALEGAASGPIYGWEAKILESIPHTRFQSAPLSEYAYSNIGYGILGLALSRAAGVPFMDLVADLIFEPLQMHSSTFMVNTPEMAARLSVGYSRNRETGELSAARATREHFGRGYKVPNGGSRPGEVRRRHDGRFAGRGPRGGEPRTDADAAAAGARLRARVPDSQPGRHHHRGARRFGSGVQRRPYPRAGLAYRCFGAAHDELQPAGRAPAANVGGNHAALMP